MLTLTDLADRASTLNPATGKAFFTEAEEEKKQGVSHTGVSDGIEGMNIDSGAGCRIVDNTGAELNKLVTLCADGQVAYEAVIERLQKGKHKSLMQ